MLGNLLLCQLLWAYCPSLFHFNLTVSLWFRCSMISLPLCVCHPPLFLHHEYAVTYICVVYHDLDFIYTLPLYIYASHHCVCFIYMLLYIYKCCLSWSWLYVHAAPIYLCHPPLFWFMNILRYIYINDVYPCLGFICMLPLCMYRPSCRLLHEHAIMHIYMLPMALVLYTYCPCIYMLSTITLATYICCLLMFPHHICLELTQVDWLVFSTSCKRPIADFLIHQRFRISHIPSSYPEKALIWPYCQKRKVWRKSFRYYLSFQKI